jgi:hypothetical protein
MKYFIISAIVKREIENLRILYKISEKTYGHLSLSDFDFKIFYRKTKGINHHTIE